MTPSPSEFREEVEKLERKHAENPEGRYFVPLANAYRRSGDFRRAMSLLRQGLEKHPDYLSAHIVLGRCLADQGEIGAAEAEFRYVLSLDPQNLIALRTLGELAAGQRNLADARKWYEELLSVDPMNEDARRALENLEASAAQPGGDRRDTIQGDSAPWEWPAPETLGDSAVPSPASDTAAQDTHESLFETMIDLDGSASGNDPFVDEENAVVTETIAELYTRQGFYDRAADVYRELIRRRGSDASLEERLRQVLELATGAASPERASGVFASGDEAVSIEESQVEPFVPEIVADHFASSFEEGFTSSPPGAQENDAEPGLVGGLLEEGEAVVTEGPPIVEEAMGYETGYEADESMIPAQTDAEPSTVQDVDATPAWVEPEQVAGNESVTIRASLASLLSWTSSANATKAPAEPYVPFTPADVEIPADGGFPAEAATVTDDETDIWVREGFVTDDLAPAGLESDALGREIEAALPLIEAQATAEEDHSWLTGSDFILEDEPPASASPAAPEPEGRLPLASDLIDDELFPWELPASHPAVAEATEIQAAPLFTEDFTFPEEPMGIREDPPETHVTDSDAVPLIEPLSDQFLPPDSSSATPAEPEGNDETATEDDDLESFQSWLRSLKR